MVISRKKTSQVSCRKFDTDVVAKNVWSCLLKDFQSSEGSGFAAKADRSFLNGIADFRDYKFPELGIVHPLRYKRWRQLESLFKKYRFQQDKYTDDELNSLTRDNFFLEQERISTAKPVSSMLHQVLQRARKHARRILGLYDPEKTVAGSRFGRKSSIGCPLALAYIDHKLTDVRAFTGSSECSKWFFRDALPGDPILKELLARMDNHLEADLLHESLNLVLVPKSWKTHRPITPLTLIALYYSYGVGEQVTSALKGEGLDISRLQSRHQRLVKQFSISRTHATADLSAASDSLTSELVNRILPREWFNAVKRTFSRQLVVDGSTSIHYTSSVLPMGNGLTFPIETLVFYVLLKAIAELTKVRGLISVYGDDLIYPSGLHKYVAVIFPQLGLKLNLDKTFVKAPFRESCGSDFYRGVDVRPFFFPDTHQYLTRTKYAVFLYKAINGLRRRWDDVDVKRTLRYLLEEVSRLHLPIYRVPPSFPDTAGVKVSSPGVIPLDIRVFPWAPIHVRFVNGSRNFHFKYLTVTANKRAVVAVLPYYWLALQGLDDEVPEYDNFWETSILDDAPRTSLSWTALKRVRSWKDTSGRIKRKNIVKYVPESSSRKGVKIQVTRHKTESIYSDWI